MGVFRKFQSERGPFPNSLFFFKLTLAEIRWDRTLGFGLRTRMGPNFRCHRELGAAFGRNQKCLLKKQDVAPLQYRAACGRNHRCLLKKQDVTAL
jgi:hypothetical protein